MKRSVLRLLGSRCTRSERARSVTLHTHEPPEGYTYTRWTNTVRIIQGTVSRGNEARLIETSVCVCVYLHACEVVVPEYSSIELLSSCSLCELKVERLACVSGSVNTHTHPPIKNNLELCLMHHESHKGLFQITDRQYAN